MPYIPRSVLTVEIPSKPLQSNSRSQARSTRSSTRHDLAEKSIDTQATVSLPPSSTKSTSKKREIIKRQHDKGKGKQKEREESNNDNGNEMDDTADDNGNEMDNIADAR